ncbi:uncharacterized protein LOC134768977 [Penaeus indicus]|uniref:uncharacterized protein LOC134768977 n=1 Tax=Penaeus indicus TaxID=29960 RepID=UPI00300D9D89
MNMKSLLVVLLDAFLAATVVGDTAAKADKPSTWTRPAAKTPNESPKLNTAGTWTPDPSQLLGEYEEPPPPRDTNAYFMTDNNTVVTVQVGMTADLRCQVFDVAEHETVSWIRRRDHHLITVGAATYSNDERFQVTFSENSQDWTLHVRYAQPRDAGVYECQLSAHPPIGVYTTLNVIEAKAEIEGESEIYVQTGSSVQLTCKLKDFTEPPTYVFWFHAEHMVNYDSNKRCNRNPVPRQSSPYIYLGCPDRLVGPLATCSSFEVMAAAFDVEVIIKILHEDDNSLLQGDKKRKKEISGGIAATLIHEGRC